MRVDGTNGQGVSVHDVREICYREAGNDKCNAPFLVTTVCLGCELYHGVKRDLDVWEVRGRKIMEVRISIESHRIPVGEINSRKRLQATQDGLHERVII